MPSKPQRYHHSTARYSDLISLHHFPSPHPLVLYAFTEDPEIRQARTCHDDTPIHTLRAHRDLV